MGPEMPKAGRSASCGWACGAAATARQRRDALEQLLGRQRQRAPRAAAVLAVVGEQLGSAVAQLPAMGRQMVDPLNALRHEKRSPLKITTSRVFMIPRFHSPAGLPRYAAGILTHF
jgi:hypothetical protein